MFENLEKELRGYTYWIGSCSPCSRDIHPPICESAADAIKSLNLCIFEKDHQIERLLSEIRGKCAYCSQNTGEYKASLGAFTCSYLKKGGLASSGYKNCEHWQWRGLGKDHESERECKWVERKKK